MSEKEASITGKTIASNVIWRLAERIGAEGVKFIVSVVLARILSPKEFGLCSLVLVFITILGVFRTSGIGTALVQKKKVDNLDASTALWANIGIGIILYGILFVSAPYLAQYYNQPMMAPALRVLGVTLIIGALNGIQHARISRAMQFKLFFKATLTGTIISAFVGIIMAVNGMGVWALIGQYLTNQIVDTFFLWFMIKWKPEFRFSWTRLAPLFQFGWKAYGAALIENLYNNLRTLLIGKFYSASELAFFNRGRHIPALINQNTNSAVQSVLFPAYAKYSDDRQKMLSLMRRAISVGTYIIFPCMMGLAVTSEILITVLYTRKWLPCIPYVRMASFVYALTPMHIVNLQAILAIGRSDIRLRIEIFKKAVTITILVICVNISMYAVAFSAMPLGVFALIVNSYPVKKEFNYSLLDQVKDVFPALWMSAVMGGIVYCLGLIPGKPLFILILQVASGVVTYVLLSKISGNKDYAYIKQYAFDLLKKLKKSKKPKENNKTGTERE